MNNKKARVIAFYLPQFHPIPENDKYWGKGFTEWTNVAKAKPLFKGHEQPRVPADLGFYDLRLSEVRNEQAKLAKEAGIEGFCYWHYWFGNGKQVLEKPFKAVLNSGKPDYPFCVAWANHEWSTKTWDNGSKKTKETVIFKQEYPGEEDIRNHFYELLPAFKDSRYIKVDGKLLFAIYEAHDIPNIKEFIKIWNDLAKENNLNGFHFVALSVSLPNVKLANLSNIEDTISKRFSEYYDMGFDAVNSINLKYAEFKTGGKIKKAIQSVLRKKFSGLFIEKYDYEKIINNLYTPIDCGERVYPQLVSGWDRSPRSGANAIIYYNSTPDTFRKNVKKALECVKNKEEQHKIIFLNSWNEWGEGAYMEPDLRYGKGFIDTLREELEN